MSEHQHDLVPTDDGIYCLWADCTFEITGDELPAYLTELQGQVRQLLAALEALLPYVEDEWETTRGDYGGATGAVNAARAAIAKVKGASDGD